MFLLVLFLTFLGFLAAALFRTATALRRAVVGSVVAHLAVCTRQNMPLSTALLMGALSENGTRASILRRLAHELQQGYSLSAAIARSWRRCPSLVATTIAAGETQHQLPAVLVQLQEQIADENAHLGHFRFMSPVYPLLLLFFLFWLTLGLLIFVMPKFEEIFVDFDAQLPAATEWLLSAARHIPNIAVPLAPGSDAPEWVFAVYLIVMVSMFMAVPWVVIYFVVREFVYATRRPAKPYVFSLFVDTLGWYLPVWRSMSRQRGLAAVTGVMSTGLRSGQPLHRTVADAAQLDVNIHLRRKLRIFAEELGAGQPADSTARRLGLGRALAWALDPATHRGQLIDTLEMISNYFRNCVQYKAVLMMNTFGPAATIVLGLIVGFVIYAFFTPLVALIEATAAASGM